MTKLTIEEEMAQAKKALNEKIAKLKRKQAAEEKRITDKVLLLLQDDEHVELYRELRIEAVQLLAEEREARSQKAKAARQPAPAAEAPPFQ